MRDDIVGYRPHQVRKFFRKRRRPVAPARRGGLQPRQGQQTPAEGPAQKTDSSSLFPGGQVRELWTMVDTLPRSRPSTGPVIEAVPQSAPPQDPAILPTGQPGTLELDLSEFNQTKEIVAPQPIAVRKRELNDNMIDNSSVTEPLETPEPADLEDFQDTEIELPLPVVVALQERAARRQNRGPDSESTAEFHRGVGAGLRPARSQQEISLSYHSPRCAICNHPDREAIEQGFLHWESPTLLAYEYGLGQRRAVYRHARAHGLFEKRAARTRRSLEFLMEQAETVTATADSVIRAVRAYSCVSDDGRWTEPTKRVIITHEHSHASSVHIEDDRNSEDAGVLDAVQPVGEPRLNPITLARQTHGLQAQSGKQASAPIVQSEAAENGRSEGAVSPPALP